jgi:hypothetical protein
MPSHRTQIRRREKETRDAEVSLGSLTEGGKNGSRSSIICISNGNILEIGEHIFNSNPIQFIYPGEDLLLRQPSKVADVLTIRSHLPGHNVGFVKECDHLGSQDQNTETQKKKQICLTLRESSSVGALGSGGGSNTPIGFRLTIQVSI